MDVPEFTVKFVFTLETELAFSIARAENNDREAISQITRPCALKNFKDDNEHLGLHPEIHW